MGGFGLLDKINETNNFKQKDETRNLGTRMNEYNNLINKTLKKNLEYNHCNVCYSIFNKDWKDKLISHVYDIKLGDLKNYKINEGECLRHRK